MSQYYAEGGSILDGWKMIGDAERSEDNPPNFESIKNENHMPGDLLEAEVYNAGSVACRTYGHSIVIQGYEYMEYGYDWSIRIFNDPEIQVIPYENQNSSLCIFKEGTRFYFQLLKQTLSGFQ